MEMRTNQESYQGGEMKDRKSHVDEHQDSPKYRNFVDEASPNPEMFARNYQLEALEKAKKENTIVFLETGSGKTLIAIMLLRSYAYELRKPSKYIAVFLVPTVVLVTQQGDAVEMLTDLKVRKLYGDMGVDFWTASTWKSELEQYEVFVMTPAILLNNLQHSFFKLDMIKLLIFDECHNARGRSPYACIMTEFYHRQLCSNATQLPRIFGMTASPVKSKGLSSREAYVKHIREFETLMNSKVYTVANEAVLAEFISYPTPKLKLYKHKDINPLLSLADLMKSLKIKVRSLPHLKALKELQLSEIAIEGARKRIAKLCLTFMFCLEELGVWLTLKAAESLSCNETDILFWGQKKDALSETYARNFSKDVFQVCSKCVPSEWCVGEDISADIDAGFLTAKVECLIQSLVDYRNQRDLRCIIFVERVISAIVLQSLLSQVPQFSAWETTYMVGNHSGLQPQTRKDQMKIIDAFREGAVNIIIATQILEEGLDVQSCNLVIRFDPSATVCSFIQSRGRARMQGSDYLLIVRSGDSSTLSRVSNYLASGDIMREESLRHASYPCPPLASEMYDEDFYCVESTGALVTLSSAIVLIYFYCSKLPSDRYFKPSPRFEIDGESKLGTLHLPKSCPIQTICVHGPHNMLKKIACLKACKQLHEVGALTDFLLPELEEDIDAEEIGNKVLDEEQYHYFPAELVESWAGFSERQLYHCYIFCLSQNFDYDVTPSTDIILVVKSELDKEFTATTLQLEVGRGSVTVNMKYVGTVLLSANEVHLARMFQVTILKVLIDRNLSKLQDALKGLDQEDSLASVSYLLLPSAGSNQNTCIIDWDCVKSSSMYFKNILFNGMVVRRRQRCSCSVEALRLVHTSCGVVCKCMLVNSLVFTPHNGHIYCVTDILYNMDGNSTMKLRGGGILTYKKYFQSRHGCALRYESESLLAGRHIFTIQNCLQRHTYHREKDSTTATVELPPELCAIFMSPISLSTLYSFSFVPSIMHRIEAMLLAVGLKRQMNHYTQNVQVPSIKVLEAITTKKCLEAFSLESLETLGDSFLKYAASQKLFSENKNYHEGILSKKKEKMLSNTTLCKLGCNRKLPGFIRNECFDPKVWAIPGEALSGFIDDEVLFSNIYIKGLRQIKIKVIADVVEALIGAYLSACGELSALLFMDWLGMKVDFINEIPYPRPIFSRFERYVNISHLQSLLNYSFRDASYLVEALTHGSYQVPEIPSCYQRLEFLGDSVLDYLITLHMFNSYPGITPGVLTDLRSASVNNECYAHAAVKAGLYKHLLHASSELHKQIIIFVDNVDLSVSSSFFGWESETASPKALGDIIESIAGAILIDSGFNKDAVWNSMRPLLEPLVTPNTIKYNPVSELHKICQGRSFKLNYIKTACDGIAAITAVVEADGGMILRETRSSANKKTSQRLAAKAVLQSLRAHISGL